MADKLVITIGTPLRRGDITPEYVLSLVGTLKSGKFDFEVAFREGTDIYQNRNAIACSFRGDFLLFIDTDMVWIPEDIEKLVKANRDIAGGLYLNKGNGGPVALHLNDHDGSMVYPTDEPFKCAALGTGFMLIRRLVFMVFRAHGLYPFDPVLGGEVTKDYPFLSQFPISSCPEDVSFCVKARQLGFEVWCIPTVKVGHVGVRTYMDPEAAAHWQQVMAQDLL
jgi:hypothetical protein